MKDMMMRIAKIRELVKQRDIDEIASLVDKYVLNTVFDGRSLTDTASYNLNVPLTKKLFEMGALTAHSDLCNALRTAAYRNNLDLFKQIIEKVPAENRVAMLNRKTAMHQRNILHLALWQHNDAQMARYILENYDGVDLNDADVCNNTPASLAWKNHHPELIDLIAIKGGLCETKLHRAAYSDDAYSFVRVLSAIPDRYQISMLNTQTREEKDTVLHTALKCHNLTVAMYIIENYAIDLNKQDKGGNTPLDIATKERFNSIADLLRARGAVANTTLPENIPSCSTSTLSPREFDIYFDIFHCVDHGDLEGLCHILSTLSASARIKLLKVTDAALGETILHTAAYNNSFEIVKYILDNYDVDINAKNNTGETPLDLAIERGYIEIAQLLRTHGATCSTKNIDRLNELTQVAPLANASVTKESSTTLNSLFSAILKKFFAHPMDQNDM